MTYALAINSLEAYFSDSREIQVKEIQDLDPGEIISLGQMAADALEASHEDVVVTPQ